MMYVCVCVSMCLCVCVSVCPCPCTTFMPTALGNKKSLDGCKPHVGAGNQTLVLWRAAGALNHRVVSLVTLR